MKPALLFLVPVTSAMAQFVTPVPASMPGWITPYPGAVAQNRQMGNSAESTYMVAAPARDVLSHYRSLFANAGQPFAPDAFGFGFSIRAALPECDLNISIDRYEPNTKVKVTCSPRLAATQRILDEHEQSRIRMAQNDGMKKYDNPVYPDPKPPAPPLEWPEWLVRVDGARLGVQRLPGQLKTSFLSAPTREAIQAFYVGLLQAHGYRVTEGVSPAVQQFGSWIVANSPADGGSRRNTVRVNIKPSGQNFTVELSLQ